MPATRRHSTRFREEAPEPEQPPPGPRRAALQLRKRTKRVRTASVAMAAAAAVLVVAAVAVWVSTGAPEETPRAPAPLATGEGDDPVTSTLMFGTRERGGPAVWLALLTYDGEARRGSVTYIPSHVAVEVPGRGLHVLGDALDSGGQALLLMSAENLLGLGVDRHIELSEGDARVLFEATGPLSVNVPTEVRVGAGRSAARVVFEKGRQRLPADFLVALLYTVGLDSDDQELGSRHLAFWQALFEEFAEEPDALGAAFRRAGPAIEDPATTAHEHGAFFRALAALSEDDRALGVLPAQQVSVGGSELYSTDQSELLAYMEDTVGSVPKGGSDVRVQVLNGNGEPGIGQEVASRLVGHGFKVVVSSNARRFDYDETLIITYDDTPQAEQAADRAKELIGLGDIQVSGQAQGIVDLTIVVGRDFLATL